MNETVSVKQSKFNGEVSPLLYADTTNPKYAISLRTCKNWIPTPQGPLVKRPGTRFLGFQSAASAFQSRLIPFVFSDGQTFVLEFNDATLQFWQNGQYVGTTGLGSGAVYQIATPWGLSVLPFLKFAQVGDTITICYGGQVPGFPPVHPQDLVHTGGGITPWTLGATPIAIPIANVPTAPTVNIFLYDPAQAYKQGAQVLAQGTTVGSFVLWTLIQDVVTGLAQSPPGFATGPTALTLNASNTYLNGNLWWTTSIDTAHPAVTRAWVYTAVVQDPNGVAYETGPSAITSGTGPLSTDRRVPLSFPATFTAALPAGWTVKLFRLYAANGAAQIFGWLQDMAPVGGQVYDTGAAPDYTRQPPHGTDPFRYDAFHADYPSVVGYLDQRRLFSAGLMRPITTELSKAGDLYNYDNLNSPGTGTDAFNFDLSSEVLEQMRAFKQMTRGIALTGQGEYTVAGLTGGPVARGSTSAKRQSKWGSSWVDPVVIGTGLVFNTAKNNMVRDLYPLYGLYSDIWDGQDLTVLVRHLLDYHVIKNWGFQTVPYPVLWVVRDDGVLLSMTYQHAPPSFGQTLTEGVVAWAQHPVRVGDVIGDICVVPEAPNDAVYLAVFRNSAAGFRVIERMAPVVNIASPYAAGAADPRYVQNLDSAVFYDGHNDQLGFPAASAIMSSVANPGSANPADYQPGALVHIVLSVNLFVAHDADNPYGSGFVFDPENVFGFGPVKAHITGFIDGLNVFAELDTACTAAQVAQFTLGGVTSWAVAKGRLQTPHLASYPVDSGTSQGARGIMALVDGDMQIPAVWALGLALFTTPGVVINLGIAYNADGELMDAFVPNAEIRNKFKNIHRMGFELASTRALWFGKDFNNLTEWQERTAGDGFSVMGLKTGFFEDFVVGEYTKAGRAVFRHWEPFPAILLSAVREMKIGDT